METIPYHPILKMKQEDVDTIRRSLNLNRNIINKNLDVIEEWGRKQEHLAEAFCYLDRRMLERFHILAKGSVEMTKSRIDKTLTTRRMLSNICLNKSVDVCEDISESINYVYLPFLNPKDQSRISVTQTRNVDKFCLLSFLRYCSMIGEYRICFDYTVSERCILDLQNLHHVSSLTKLNPILMKQAECLATDCYGVRVTGIHILNAPPFIDKFLSIFKSLLKEKISRRIHVHKTNEELHKEISKTILPEDYGGDLQNCAQLEEQWKNVLRTEEARKLNNIFDKLVTDESKRSAYKFNEDYLGMPGSFRQLTVD